MPHIFVEIDHENIFYGQSPRFPDSRSAVVSYNQKFVHDELALKSLSLSLLRKKCVVK